jgi:hypothetical protein
MKLLLQCSPGVSTPQNPLRRQFSTPLHNWCATSTLPLLVKLTSDRIPPNTFDEVLF